MNKYIILVGDGMADFAIPELGNKTPLEYAHTPNMDLVAKNGMVGLVSTVPEGFSPGSDVANLSLMGYAPQHYYSGRAPVEAASLGISLQSNQTAFRCNLVTIENERMIDYSAGHIDTITATAIINELQKAFGTETIRFHPGVGYRHLTIIDNFPDGLICTPPHDITDREIYEYLPHGNSVELIKSLMREARKVIASTDAVKRKNKEGLRVPTDIWLWGQGHAVKLPYLSERYGIKGSVISAVDLIRGLGILAGLEVRIVEGATGYLGTNYKGKMAAAIEALEKEDFVYLHIEAPDETSHEGSLQKKIQAIEEFDKNIVGETLKIQQEMGNLRILVAPDHATPVILKTHAPGAVPYTICGPGVSTDDATSYCELSAEGKTVVSGPELFEFFIKG
ncbi:MAG: cofactor-independent phosphoglycerate mutase [Fibrobacter sp.]|nr:cofactor-independent phosphoglycerate mutase [Fibrobacter sp.]